MTSNTLPAWAEPAEPAAAKDELPVWAERADAPAAKPTETPEAPGMFRTALAHAYDTASMGTAPALEDSRQHMITSGTPGGGPPEGALRKDLETALTEGAKANPYSAAVGDLFGFVAGAGAAGLPTVGKAAAGVGAKLAPFLGRFVGQRVGRGLAGAGFGGLASGAQTLAATHDPAKAWEATKSGAMMGGAAMAAPEITAPATILHGLGNDNPVESASEITNGLALGIPTAMGKLQIPGRALEGVGQSARDTLVQSLIKELLPQMNESVAARNKAAETRTKDIFREHRRAKSPLSSAPEGGTSTPSIPGQPDLEAQALGKLGAKVKDNFAYLRSKDPLGLKLTPEAEAGVKNILPDYEAQANSELGQFSEGKGPVLDRILAGLKNPGAAPGAVPPKPPLPRNMGFDIGFAGIKPNPTAGYTPEPLHTAESIAPVAHEAANTQLLQMRQKQGITSRLASGAAKGATGLLGQGGLLTGHSLGGAAAGGGLGAGKALLNDPVLATSVTEPLGRGMQATGKLGDRISNFLAGATGPLLTKKLEFLMKNDPEFRAAAEASNGQ